MSAIFAKKKGPAPGQVTANLAGASIGPEDFVALRSRRQLLYVRHRRRIGRRVNARRSFKIATQLPFGLIEHVRSQDGAVAHCLPRRALPSFLQLQ